MQEDIFDTLKSTDTQKWFLRILNNSIFGPVTLNTLCNWADQARIIPGHHISSDKKEWIAVETVKEFHMIWKVSMKNGNIYGPVNISLIKSLVEHDIIGSTTSITNIITGETTTIINHLLKLTNENNNLQLKLKESSSRYLKTNTKYDKLKQQLKEEQELRKHDQTENQKIQQELKNQIEQFEKEKNNIEVIDVYPETIQINNDQSPSDKKIYTPETLEQLESQAARDLEIWHDQYKKSNRGKKKLFSPIKLFK